LGFDIKIIHQRIQATRSNALHSCHCHYCNVDFVLFQNVTCYINSSLRHFQVNTTNFLNTTCIFGCHMHDIRKVRVYWGWAQISTHLCGVLGYKVLTPNIWASLNETGQGLP
jgi:hypothetical protein